MACRPKLCGKTPVDQDRPACSRPHSEFHAVVDVGAVEMSCGRVQCRVFGGERGEERFGFGDGVDVSGEFSGGVVEGGACDGMAGGPGAPGGDCLVEGGVVDAVLAQLGGSAVRRGAGRSSGPARAHRAATGSARRARSPGAAVRVAVRVGVRRVGVRRVVGGG